MGILMVQQQCGASPHLPKIWIGASPPLSQTQSAHLITFPFYPYHPIISTPSPTLPCPCSTLSSLHPESCAKLSASASPARSSCTWAFVLPPNAPAYTSLHCWKDGHNYHRAVRAGGMLVPPVRQPNGIGLPI